MPRVCRKWVLTGAFANSHRQSPQRVLKSFKIDRLDQMHFEPCFAAALDVFFAAVAADGYAAEAAGADVFHDVDAGPVGEADVADEKIEMELIGQIESFTDCCGGGDLAADVGQNPLHRAARVGVIFNEQNMQRSRQDDSPFIINLSRPDPNAER
jgi:hypothetical protein